MTYYYKISKFSTNQGGKNFSVCFHKTCVSVTLDVEKYPISAIFIHRNVDIFMLKHTKKYGTYALLHKGRKKVQTALEKNILFHHNMNINII